ncbi:hypothetical protein ACI50E_13740 [Brucella sp. ZJ1_1]|uniref:Uncharacterized protein n=1 Tax=Brucella intermedia GD04153 TaxID=2975438 RepID=A0AA42GZ20_9HYPH|nr:hypothetical protein [Brucella intermedia]MCO7738937.1 hypothetical protein [Brucella intermedia]MDH0124994.1 hypothetical protein [Brucella intermedia GD04153]MDL2204534.1 hypothetical protein [Brucella intermedia]QNQ42515.1 hypothetical protein IAR37_13515 [Brucella intermedia]UXO85047.1 hypothetical protein N8I72_21270 [Brucella intermedia]
MASLQSLGAYYRRAKGSLGAFKDELSQMISKLTPADCPVLNKGTRGNAAFPIEQPLRFPQVIEVTPLIPVLQPLWVLPRSRSSSHAVTQTGGVHTVTIGKTKIAAIIKKKIRQPGGTAR